MLHFRGHHREAQEALNLLKNWRDCGSADGALAKVAEMLPGVDAAWTGFSPSRRQLQRGSSPVHWVFRRVAH
eukprot:g25891.t1